VDSDAEAGPGWPTRTVPRDPGRNRLLLASSAVAPAGDSGQVMNLLGAPTGAYVVSAVLASR